MNIAILTPLQEELLDKKPEAKRCGSVVKQDIETLEPTVFRRLIEIEKLLSSAQFSYQSKLY
jgi:hypothetical protein